MAASRKSRLPYAALGAHFSRFELGVGLSAGVRGLSLRFFKTGKISTMPATQGPPPESVKGGRLCKI